MDASTLQEQVKHLSAAGSVTLNIDERLKIELALDTLQDAMNFEHIQLWGKINGLESDYFIAVGTCSSGQKGFAQRRFFWCTEQNYTFSEMPAPRLGLKPVFEQLQVLFSGMHTNIVVDAKGHCAQCRLEPASLKCLDGKDVTELDRLSYTVCQIDMQCTVVPCGSYKMTPLNEVHRNEAFEGCMMEKICDLSSYMHLRPVQTQDKKSLADRKQDIFEGDFLDSAACGSKASGVWSVMRDLTQRMCVLRNRVWPGAMAYHRANTQVYGNFYMGNGLKNCDLAFQI